MPTTQAYDNFISTKRIENKNYGVIVKDKDIHSKLFDFQKDVVKWACRER